MLNLSNYTVTEGDDENFLSYEDKFLLKVNGVDLSEFVNVKMNKGEGLFGKLFCAIRLLNCCLQPCKRFRRRGLPSSPFRRHGY